MLLSTKDASSAEVRRSHRLILILAISITHSTGCWRSEMGTVAGSLTKDGKPVAKVGLTFITTGRPTSVGTTDADGRFTLSTRRLNDGAYAGQHVVVIRRDPPTGDRYEDPAKTPLKAEVIAGRHNVVDLVIGR